MVYSPTGSSYLFFILGCMTSNFLHISFSTLYSSSLQRTDTIVFAKSNKHLPRAEIGPPPLLIPPLPPSNVFELNKTPPPGEGGLIEDLGGGTLWVFYSDFSYLPARCKSFCQVHHHTYPSHIHLALNTMTLTAHRHTHLSINIRYTLLFIQNILLFLIGSKPPANSS